MFLLDTPVLLDLRGAQAPDADPRLIEWARAIPKERLFVSALSLVEIEGAAMRMARADKGRGAALREWIDERLRPAFDGHVLAVDAAVARRRGTLALEDARDAILAATALEHRLVLVTRDKAAFRGARVKLLDPRDRSEPAETPGDWRAATRTGPTWLRQLFIRG